MQQIELPGLRQEQPQSQQQPADQLISRNPNADSSALDPVRSNTNQPLTTNPRNQPNTTIAQTNKEFDRLILRYQYWIFIIVALIQTFNAVYLLLFCWINKGACISDGTEIRGWCPGFMAAIFFITVAMGYICYTSSQSASKGFLRRLKWINFIYIIFTLVLGIIGFATIATIDTSSLATVWGRLTQYEKIYFTSSPSNLVSTYQKNLLLFGIYMIVLAALFIVLTCFMFQYDQYLQDGWRPPVKPRTSFAKELFLKFRREYEAIPINPGSPELKATSPPQKGDKKEERRRII